jgi:hypothetical protein
MLKFDEILNLLRVAGRRRVLNRCYRIALRFNCLEHFQYQLETLQFAHDLRFDPRWQRASISRTEALERLQPIRPDGFAVIDAVQRAESLDAVDVLDTFGYQATALAVQPALIFFSDSWHAHDAPHLGLAAQMRHQRPQHSTRIDAIRLSSTRTPIDLHARRKSDARGGVQVPIVGQDAYFRRMTRK